MGRNDGTVQLWPTWVRTIEQMRRHNTTVHAQCYKCSTRSIVTPPDLEALERKLGPWNTLIDKHPPCKIILNGTRCPGTIFFIAPGRFGFMDLPLVTRSNRKTPN